MTRRWLGPALAALLLAAAACWLAWPRAYHCGCYEPRCALPCSSCCPGAMPHGCPPPSVGGLRPDPAPELCHTPASR